MNLYHTSPSEIKEISKFGKFDDCLFFSSNVYEMSACETVLYSIDATEMNFISASDLYDDEIIEDIASFFGVDADVAELLLDGSDSVWNHAFADGEADWYIQTRRGECAKKMCYDGCEDEDEQGTVYIIPMLNRESILNKI